MTHFCERAAGARIKYVPATLVRAALGPPGELRSIYVRPGASEHRDAVHEA